MATLCIDSKEEVELAFPQDVDFEQPEECMILEAQGKDGTKYVVQIREEDVLEYLRIHLS